MLRWLVCMMCVALIGGAATRPAKSARQREAAALSHAIDELVWEYAQVLKDPNQPIRVECDYFKQSPSPDVTQAGVLSMLEKTGGNVRVESYVKWQLLSAIDGRFDDSQAKRAVAAYRQCPVLMIRPGISDASKYALDMAANGQLQEAHEIIEYKLYDEVGKFNAYNSPILRYRSELYSKLPVTYESLLAGCEDLWQRLMCGIDDLEVRPLVQQLTKNIRAWLETNPPQRQIEVIARAVTTLSRAKGPVTYDGLKWIHRENRFVWLTKQRDLAFEGELSSLEDDLNRMARKE